MQQKWEGLEVQGAQEEEEERVVVGAEKQTRPGSWRSLGWAVARDRPGGVGADVVQS